MDAAALMLMAYVGGRAPVGPDASAPPHEISAAARRTACQARASGPGWSWRLVDGRRCWYPGRRARPKSGLFWPPAATPSPPNPMPPMPMPLPRERPLAAPTRALMFAAVPAELTDRVIEAAAIFARVPAVGVGVSGSPDSHKIPASAILTAEAPPEPLDEPLPVWRVRTVVYRTPAPPPSPRPGPAWLTLILWGLGLGSALLVIAAARRPSARPS